MKKEKTGKLLLPGKKPAKGERENMSPKELLYVDDALSHAKFLETQCTTAATQVTDPKLKTCLQQMADKHRQTFTSFYNLV